jgi:hypothetical protein
VVDFQRYLHVLKNDKIRKPKIRVEFLRYEDETVRETITGYVLNNSGSISISNKNGQRRSASFTLTNIEGQFTPNPDGVWIRQKIRIWTGLEIDGEDYMFKQGVFVIEDPTAVSKGSNKTITISASDKFSLADGSIGGETEGIYEIPQGSLITTAIKAILNPSDDIKREVFYDPILPIIGVEFEGMTTPYTITISSGEAVGEMLMQIAHMVSANIFYNVDGQLVFESDTDDNIKGSQFDFEDGDIVYMGTSQKFLNSKVYNSVLVIGSNVNGGIVSSYLENNNPLSETSIENLGFKRTLKVEDQNIWTEELASLRAIYELKRVINLQSEHSLECVPMYHLDADQVLTITDENLRIFRRRYLINSINLPLGTSGTMSINCSESIDLLLGEYSPE